MAGSPAYARIKADVLAIVGALPYGRVTTHALIGARLSVIPRHVAYILATLDDIDRDRVPWHRVVAQGGAIGRHKRRDDQISRLRAEGVPVSAAGIVAGLDGVVVTRLAAARSRPDGRQATPDEMGSATAGMEPRASRARGRFEHPGTRLK